MRYMAFRGRVRKGLQATPSAVPLAVTLVARVGHIDRSHSLRWASPRSQCVHLCRSRTPEPTLRPDRWFLSVCHPKAESVERGATSRARSLRFDTKSCSVNNEGLSEIDGPFPVPPPRDNRERNDNQEQREETTGNGTTIRSREKRPPVLRPCANHCFHRLS